MRRLWFHVRVSLLRVSNFAGEVAARRSTGLSTRRYVVQDISRANAAGSGRLRQHYTQQLQHKRLQGLLKLETNFIIRIRKLNECE